MTTANIGARGAQRRLRGGIAWLVLAIGASIALVLSDVQRNWRLLLVVPLVLAASGFLQAREKT